MAKTLHELLQAAYGIKTQLQESDPTFQVGVAETKILPYNPNRVGLVMVNNGGANVTIKPSRPCALGKSILLLANGGTATFKWDVDFELVASEWFGIANGAASDFYTLEIVATN